MEPCTPFLPASHVVSQHVDLVMRRRVSLKSPDHPQPQVAFVREPIARIISNWEHCRRTQEESERSRVLGKLTLVMLVVSLARMYHST